ncbi:MAG: deoxyribodipyrimidine photo-lyase [Oxalobacter sp.]|nr:MAG: deoxyribodipyrimidine photo-lyase [Oxalobacter sp.]
MDAALVWFRRDLRDFDHAALHHALRQSRRVYAVFVFDTDILDALRTEGAPHDNIADRRLAFIHAAVLELAAALREMGGALIVRTGRAVDLIPQLAKALGVDAVFANHDYEPQAVARDAQVAQQLQQNGQRWFSFKDQVIYEKDEVLTQADRPFTVFTPYKRAWLKKLFADENATPPFPALQPHLIEPYRKHFSTATPDLLAGIPTLEQMGFAPIAPSMLPFAAGMSGGENMTQTFWRRLSKYDSSRDFPAQDATSHLSVHLRFGTVSIRTLVRHAVDALRLGEGQGAAVWLAELIWRDFYFQILHYFPHVVDQAFKPAFDKIEWEEGGEALVNFDCWCQGHTGFPLVDAAMMQLNTTGFMHNRLRMVTASFLIKDLGIDWRWGEQYFARQLNDFDLAANNGGWQWAASSGCDAQPYFRIFNPVTQSQKFDPEGAFIKRYLPQLRKLDNKHIHAPWLASEPVLEKAGVSLGENYPYPIIEHDVARKQTLARYAVVKSGRS